MGDRLATVDMGRKLGAVPFGELGPHVTQCGLGRGLPSYQVASWSIQPFGHNRYGPKIGDCAPFGRGAGSPSNTMWWGPRSTCVPSSILIHPTVWPQDTSVIQTGRQTGQDRTGQRSDSIGRTSYKRSPKTIFVCFHLFQVDTGQCTPQCESMKKLRVIWRRNVNWGGWEVYGGEKRGSRQKERG